MFKKILIAVAVVVLVFVAVVAMQPAEYQINRSTMIAATPEAVFAHVNDFHKWEAWSPWAKLDPNAKNSFEGPAEGEGAIFRWAGNSEVGEGSMIILESRPGELVRIQLDFIKPFEDTATSEFTFRPQGEQAEVTWSMYGRNNFLGRIFCLFMDMDKMLGGEFDKGLASLKAVVEGETRESETPAAGE